jgi:PEGA domain
MDEDSVAAQGWSVSSHRRGEVLSAHVQGAGVDLILLGNLGRFTVPEIEGWLRELIGVADDASRPMDLTTGRPAVSTLPRLLHNLLTGLLFYQAELWPGEDGPCAVAFVDDGEQAAFGWVGAAEAELIVDHAPVEPAWIRVRDEEGREARAMMIARDRGSRVRIRWAPSVPVAGEASLDASWTAQDVGAAFAEHAAAEPGLSTAVAGITEAWQPYDAVPIVSPSDVHDPTVPSIETHEPAQLTEPSEREVQEESVSAAAGGRERSTWHFRSWVESLSQELELDAATPLDEAMADPSESEAVAATSSQESVPGVTQAEPVESFGSAEQAPPRFIMPSQESEVAPAELGDVFDVPSVPDLIPPSPEPAELSARAIPIDWDEPPFETPFEVEAPVADSSEFDRTSIPGEETLEDEPSTSGAQLDARVDAVSPALEDLAETQDSFEMPPGPVASQPGLSIDPIFESADPGAAETMVDVAPFPMADENSAGSEGEEVASEAPPSSRRPQTPRRPAWPAPEDVEAGPSFARRAMPWAAVVLTLFAVGWLLGSMDNGKPRGGSFLARTLDRFGFGPARFEAVFESRPSGAVIAIDGAETSQRTPATIALSAGAHQVTLSFPAMGSASYNVHGERGQHVPLQAALWGTLIVSAPDAGLPVAVTVDEIARGMAPMTVDSLSPGPHQVRFSGPGLQPWERTIEVHINQTAEILAQATLSPATGIIEVRATSSDEAASQVLAGGTVWVDGQMRGVTPLRLELPQGPHSIRVAYHSEDAPVQVIDLPGGNQRFATFDLGLATQRPRLVQASPLMRIPIDRPTVLSATLQTVAQSDVREMWLHVRTPDGTWRRYPMSTLDAAGGTVGVSVFPTTLFDPHGRVPYYLSASTQTGDEYFTEIQFAESAPTPGAR